MLGGSAAGALDLAGRDATANQVEVVHPR